MIWDDDTRALFAERAGIMEFDGGLPRAEAERRAREIVEHIVEQEPEQPQLDLGHQEFRRRRRELWNDY